MFEIIIIRVPDTAKFEAKGYKVIRIDRQTPVGNPFYMSSETERNKVCEQYQAYFDRKVSEKIDIDFMHYLRGIYLYAQRQPVALACWCAPKRCHGETIKKFIESYKEVK